MSKDQTRQDRCGVDQCNDEWKELKPVALDTTYAPVLVLWVEQEVMDAIFHVPFLYRFLLRQPIRSQFRMKKWKRHHPSHFLVPRWIC